MNRFSIIALVALSLMVGGVGLGLVSPIPVGAQDFNVGDSDDLNIPTVDVGSSSTLMQDILNTVFLIAGGLATVFIIVGGLKYVLSAGKPDDIQKAKNTIVYAAVGLVIAVMASVIVNFVVSSV